MYNMNSGYVGYKMSKRAYQAYNNGEKPLSKWLKKDIIALIVNNTDNEEIIDILKKAPVVFLKNKLLSYSAYHHTGSYCNETNFYEFDTDKLENIINDGAEDLLDKIDKYKKKQKKINTKKQEKEKKWYYANIKFCYWVGSRRKPKLEESEEKGIVLGNWFYGFSGIKKNTEGKHIIRIRKYGHDIPENFDKNDCEILREKLKIQS